MYLLGSATSYEILQRKVPENFLSSSSFKQPVSEPAHLRLKGMKEMSEKLYMFRQVRNVKATSTKDSYRI
jgi:hypothetical protein